MIKKREACLYCGEKMESKTAKKKFCSDKCKVYYGRELKRGTLDMPKVGDIAVNGIVTERKQHNHSLTVTIQPLNQDERNGIEKQIKEWENKKCPSYMPSKDAFEKIRQKEILELKTKLKKHRQNTYLLLKKNLRV